MASQQTLTLYGNVGKQPTLRSFPAREEVKTFYNPLIEGPDTKVVVVPAADFKTFSIATTLRNPEGQRVTTWVDVVDHQNLAGKSLVAKGDRVAVTGYFKERTVGEKTFRNFVLSDLRVERRKPAPEIP